MTEIEYSDGLDPLRAAALPADAPGAWIMAAIDALRAERDAED